MVIRNLVVSSALLAGTAIATVSPAHAGGAAYWGPHGYGAVHWGPVRGWGPCCYGGRVAAGAAAGLAVGTAVGIAAASRPAYVAPPPVVYAAPPPVVYAAPPVVYAAPGYAYVP